MFNKAQGTHWTRRIRASIVLVYASLIAGPTGVACSYGATEGDTNPSYSSDGSGREITTDGATESSPEQGCDGCACYPNSTCDKGLACVEDLCESAGVGCDSCECYPNATCNAGLNCIGGRCEPIATTRCSDDAACEEGFLCVTGVCEAEPPEECSDDDGCPIGEVCVSGTCAPEGCGNDVVEEGEECDDGNVINGDGCSRICLIEANGPLFGDDTALATDPNAAGIDFSECLNPSLASAYAPVDTLTVSLCGVVFGAHTSRATAEANLALAAEYYTAASSEIEFDIRGATVVRDATTSQTNPISRAAVDNTGSDARQKANEFWGAGECDVVIAYTSDVRTERGEIAGRRTLAPSTAVVGRSNAAWTTAHEIGHIFGLLHTHEPGAAGDGCADTSYDPPCFEANQGCAVECSDGSAPPAENVLSYYHCAEPGPDSLSACQVNRARCHIALMFPGAECPLPRLLSPEEGELSAVEQPVVFEWEVNDDSADHTLTISRDAASVFQTNAGTDASATVEGSYFEVAGVYEWTVSTAGACCPEEGCVSAAGQFEVEELGCSGGATIPCGNCGSMTRICDPATGEWQTTACEGAGVCTPGTTNLCGDGSGQTQTCTETCEWDATCPGCEPEMLTEECNPNDGNVWWKNACDQWSVLKDTCDGGTQCNAATATCECEDDVSTVCDGTSVYNADSCGNMTTFVQACAEEDVGEWTCNGSTTRVRTVVPADTCSGGACRPGTARQDSEDCLGGRECHRGECVCRSEADTQCYLGSVYFYDSCGVRGERVETCGGTSYGAWTCMGASQRTRTVSSSTCSGGACVSQTLPNETLSCGTGRICDASSGSCICEPQASYRCYSGDVYYYDGCGSRTDMKDNCTSSEVCDSVTSTCVPSCSAASYWTPTSVSGSSGSFSYHFFQSTSRKTDHTSPAMEVNVDASGENLRIRVCRGGGATFSSSGSLHLHYTDSFGAGFSTVFNGTLSYSARANCTAWATVSTNYPEGRTIGGPARVVVPSTYQSHWSLDCTDDYSSGYPMGNCWYLLGVPVTTRTCKN